jgi:hypothetical protein
VIVSDDNGKRGVNDDSVVGVDDVDDTPVVAAAAADEETDCLLLALLTRGVRNEFRLDDPLDDGGRGDTIDNGATVGLIIDQRKVPLSTSH